MALERDASADILKVLDHAVDQTSLTGAFLSRLANFVFMAAGGLLMLVGILIESYALWPIGQALPDLAQLGVTLFEVEFSSFFQLMLLITAPMLVVLFIIDSVLGLVNRYAQQLNVFFLSMSLKALAAVAMLLVMVPSLVQLIIDKIADHSGLILESLKQLLGG